MAWWNSIFGNKDEEFSALQENTREEFAGLNFKTAMESHLRWKLRLKSVIDGTSTETLDPAVVASDNQCVLGKWIDSEGTRQFGAYPGFKKVVTAHTHFHKCAGHTLDLAMNGKINEADAELISGDFARASLDVSRHLMRLWREVGIDK
ncbi:MAG: hypothetical protein A2342_08210 [Gallionellales bacterium RIFOXYB12_FULL_54_9]|nr:MAG: hypothetical protein A2342_08210 [Gallionellales bacterium RIFOXYB12_FULL_54_9]